MPCGSSATRGFLPNGYCRLLSTDKATAGGYRPGMFGEELRKAREQAKMTQEELAFAASVDRTYVSQLENNKKSPTLDMLFRLCDALGIQASRIVSRVEKSR